MDMISGERIVAAGLADWCKLAQGLHARYLTGGFAAGARFAAAIATAGDDAGHHPTVTIGPGHVDLELVSDDAVYRQADGRELVVEWVTQQDLDLAPTISGIAVRQGLTPDPASVMVVELGLDTPSSASIAPMWAALLTGRADAQGHGSPSDEIRDPTGRTPNLWFGIAGTKGGTNAGPRPPWHVEVYVSPAEAARRIAAAVAAGGVVVVEGSDAPAMTVLADQDGNRGVVCVDVSAYPRVSRST